MKSLTRSLFKSLCGTGGVVMALIASASASTPARAQDPVVNVASEGAKRLKVVNSPGFFHLTSPGWVTLTSTTIQIPAGFNESRIVARFSGESNCQGPYGSWCTIRVLVDGKELRPVNSGNFNFDSSGDIWSGLSVERTSRILPSGVHTVTLEGALNFATEWFLDDWQLTLEVWRVS